MNAESVSVITAVLVVFGAISFVMALLLPFFVFKIRNQIIKLVEIDEQMLQLIITVRDRVLPGNSKSRKEQL